MRKKRNVSPRLYKEGSVCIWENCTEKPIAKNFCGKHYTENWRNNGKCSFPGCSNRLRNTKLCATHYLQLKAGKELVPIRPKFEYSKDWKLTCKTLREIIYCAPSDGVPYWIQSKNRKTKINDLLGAIDNNGYRKVTINSKPYMWHRLMFLYFYGFMPTDGEVIDHIDGNRSNNALENLRVVRMTENNANRGNGIFVDRHGKWGARKIGFDTREEAVKAYKKLSECT